jgi:hypothetical protein
VVSGHQADEPYCFQAIVISARKLQVRKQRFSTSAQRKYKKSRGPTSSPASAGLFCGRKWPIPEISIFTRKTFRRPLLEKAAALTPTIPVPS